jgi:hypothetical protein
MVVAQTEKNLYGGVGYMCHGWKTADPVGSRIHCLHCACTWERQVPGLRRADAERVVLHQVGTDGRNGRLEAVGPGHKGREAHADGLLGSGDQRALIANIEIVHIWRAE